MFHLKNRRTFTLFTTSETNRLYRGTDCTSLVAERSRLAFRNVTGILDEREVVHHLLQSDDLTRDKLGNRQADDIGDGPHVCDESSHVGTRQAVRLRTKTEDNFVAIDDIDIEMDGHMRAPQRASATREAADSRGEARQDETI